MLPHLLPTFPRSSSPLPIPAPHPRSSGRGVAEVFVLSTFVYLFGFIYHALAFLATWLFNRNKAKFVDTSRWTPGAVSHSADGSSPPNSAPQNFAPNSPAAAPIPVMNTPAQPAPGTAANTPAALSIPSGGSRVSHASSVRSSPRTPGLLENITESARDMASRLSLAHEGAVREGAHVAMKRKITVRALGLNR